MHKAQDAQIAVAHDDLGWRIVQVATLALIAHLSEKNTRQQTSTSSVESRVAGGAGRDISTDGSLPHFAEGEAA